MKILKISSLASLCSLLVVLGCAKDKNMDDYRRDQLQQSISRITAVSGSYTGSVISKIDGTNLGSITLKFQASPGIQSNPSCQSNDQNARVNGSISLRSISTTEVSFESGCYDDVSGDFQATITSAKIAITGHISGDSWIGTMEVTGQPQNGADLNLQRNAPQTNTPTIEVGGIRLEQIRKLDYLFEGLYKVNDVVSPFKLSFTNRDVLPEQVLYKLFSPVREVSVNCDLGGFELNFSNAILDDNLGTLVAHDPTDQQGRPARANLSCKNFQEGTDFGWDCVVQTKVSILRTHLIAKK